MGSEKWMRSTSGWALQDRLAHAVERRLHRRAVVVAEGLQDGGAHAVPKPVEVELGAARVGPRAVSTVAMMRSSVSGSVVYSSRRKPAQPLPVDAARAGPRSRPRSGRPSPVQVTVATRSPLAARRKPCGSGRPSDSRRSHGCSVTRTRASRTLGPTVSEALGDRERVRLDRAREVLGGQRVGRVAHRVGGQQAGVVALHVGGREVALQRDVDLQVAQLVPIGTLEHLDHAHAALAVVVLSEDDAAVGRRLLTRIRAAHRDG